MASATPRKATFFPLGLGSLECFSQNRMYNGMRKRVNDCGSLIPVQNTNVGVSANDSVAA
jgi:hypothetical protein